MIPRCPWELCHVQTKQSNKKLEAGDILCERGGKFLHVNSLILALPAKNERAPSKSSWAIRLWGGLQTWCWGWFWGVATVATSLHQNLVWQGPESPHDISWRRHNAAPFLAQCLAHHRSQVTRHYAPFGAGLGLPGEAESESWGWVKWGT